MDDPDRPSCAVLACPVCWQPLARDGRAFRCWTGHSFDIAKEGYVNLLLPQRRHSKDPGYSQAMIAGRRDFFATGHYQRLADEIAGIIRSRLPGKTRPVVIDAGCGEGYYLRRLRLALAGTEPLAGTALCGLDISRHAVRAAARRDSDGLYAVAGTYQMPVLPGRVDVLLSHFSPVSPDDFRRVVRPGGIVLIGGPGPRHLYSFKELIYDTPAAHEQSEPLTGQDGFEPAGRYQIRYEIALRGPGQIASLLAMTPYYWSAGPQTQARLGASESLDTEVDVIVHAYRRTGTAARIRRTGSVHVEARMPRLRLQRLQEPAHPLRPARPDRADHQPWTSAAAG